MVQHLLLPQRLVCRPLQHWRLMALMALMVLLVLLVLLVLPLLPQPNYLMLVCLVLVFQ